jgi:hypothetical protein
MDIAHARHAHIHLGDDVTLSHGFDGEGQPANPAGERSGSAGASPLSAAERLHRGHVQLDSALLRRLRQGKLMSQQDLADDCWRRNIQLSLTTIKRAEAGRAVRFRIAREFARCFDVPVGRIVRADTQVEACEH